MDPHRWFGASRCQRGTPTDGEPQDVPPSSPVRRRLIPASRRPNAGKEVSVPYLYIHIAVAQEADRYAAHRTAAAAAAKAKRMWPDVIGDVLAEEIMTMMDLPSWARSQTRTQRLIDAILSITEAGGAATQALPDGFRARAWWRCRAAARARSSPAGSGFRVVGNGAFGPARTTPPGGLAPPCAAPPHAGSQSPRPF